MSCRRLPVFLPLVALALAGCEQLGLGDPVKTAALKEADGKAIGSACRQSGRALEDCYVMNPKAAKAAIFAGWREMDGYMRENTIEVVRPDLVRAPGTPPPPPPPPPEDDSKAAEAETEDEGKGKDSKKTAEEQKAPAKRSAAAASPPRPPRRLT